MTGQSMAWPERRAAGNVMPGPGEPAKRGINQLNLIHPASES